MHTARTVQQVTRAEFHFLEILRLELATPTPAAWVEIFRRRLSLWQQQQVLQRLIFSQPRQQSLLFARIRLPWPMSRASPLQPVKSEQRFGSFPLYGGAGCACLQHSECASAAGH